jgi:hypothetical protein
MGTMLELKCHKCDSTRGINVGFGMRSGVENFFCSQCGQMDDHWFDAGEDNEPVEPPRCTDHPQRPMRRLSPDARVPCVSCEAGVMVISQVGLWD